MPLSCPHILQENGGGILTEGGDYLSTETGCVNVTPGGQGLIAIENYRVRQVVYGGGGIGNKTYPPRHR